MQFFLICFVENAVSFNLAHICCSGSKNWLQSITLQSDVGLKLVNLFHFQWAWQLQKLQRNLDVKLETIFCFVVFIVLKLIVVFSKVVKFRYILCDDCLYLNQGCRTYLLLPATLSITAEKAGRTTF